MLIVSAYAVAYVVEVAGRQEFGAELQSGGNLHAVAHFFVRVGVGVEEFCALPQVVAYIYGGRQSFVVDIAYAGSESVRHRVEALHVEACCIAVGGVCCRRTQQWFAQRIYEAQCYVVFLGECVHQLQTGLEAEVRYREYFIVCTRIGIFGADFYGVLYVAKDIPEVYAQRNPVPRLVCHAGKRL